MYKGTLIEDLMAAVERAEHRSDREKEILELDRWFAIGDRTADPEHGLVGVA
jgi:hypothetical protein